MKHLNAVLPTLILATLLTACEDTSSQNSSTVTVTETVTIDSSKGNEVSNTPSESQPDVATFDASTTIEGKIGYMHGMDYLAPGDCDVNFTIESIENLDTCDGSPLSIASPSADTHLVRIVALVTTRATDLWVPEEFTTWSDWSAITTDGVNHTLQRSDWCINNRTATWKGHICEQVIQSDERIMQMSPMM